jgi:hypothetical protein
MSNNESAPTAQPKSTKKLSRTAQWMIDHPNDLPCPLQPHAATAWRKARGIGANAGAERAKAAKYTEAMAEKRARETARS